jgi:hypothetical protein
MDVKTLTNLALVAALATGFTAAPAYAAKEKPAAAPAQNFSKEFRAAAGPLQKAIQAKDFVAAAAALPAVEAAATTPDDKYAAGQFRYSVSANSKDDKGMTAGAKAMLESGAAPANVVGALNLHLGREAYFAKDYPKAQAYLAEAVKQGSKTPDMLILAADVQFKLKQYPAGLALAEEAINAQKAASQPVTEDWYNRGLAAAYNAKLGAESVKWSSMLVRAYPTSSNWRSALVLYRDSKSLDAQITLDVYRLMRLTKSIAGERDYYDYAAIASERGLPGETKAVVDTAVASDAKLATSKNLAELRAAATPKIAADLASFASSEKAANSAPTGRGAMGVADGYLSYGQDAKAIPFYRLALQKGGVDADAANTRLGIALARSGDKEGARTAFQAVKGARAEVASLWLLYLDVPPTA